MKSILQVLLVTGLMLPAACSPKRDREENKGNAIATELERFQGTWVAVSEGYEGFTLVYEGDKAETYYEGRVLNKGVFKIDVSKNPKTYDYATSDATNHSVLGIYQLDGDILKCCTVLVSSNKPRPTEFLAGANGGDILVVYHRKKH